MARYKIKNNRTGIVSTFDSLHDLFRASTLERIEMVLDSGTPDVTVGDLTISKVPDLDKWSLEDDPMIRRRLGKTIEECSELIKICTRINLQGLHGRDPQTGKPNDENLLEEIADVYAQLDETVAVLGLSHDTMTNRRLAKRKSMQDWEAMYHE